MRQGIHFIISGRVHSHIVRKPGLIAERDGVPVGCDQTLKTPIAMRSIMGKSANSSELRRGVDGMPISIVGIWLRMTIPGQ
jgi:hypothetical protein